MGLKIANYDYPIGTDDDEVDGRAFYPSVGTSLSLARRTLAQFGWVLRILGLGHVDLRRI